MGYVLGIDLGTSSLKGLVFDKGGKLIGSASADYPIENPNKGYSEQNPLSWIEACELVIEKLSDNLDGFKSKLQGISFSGQMHSLVLLDSGKQVVRNAILWNDVRTTEQCKMIMNTYGKELLDITKNIALEGFTLPKIIWVQENEPDQWEKVRHILLPKDYLRFWLTDILNMDYSDAAGTLMFDMESKKWSKEILDKFQIPSGFLPELTKSTGYVGNIKKDLKEKFGFENNIKIFAGGADNACSALGSGIVSDNVAMASVGTSGVFLAKENEPLQNYEGKLHLFHHATSDSNYSMGVTLAAGNSLDWYKKTFANDKSYDELLENIDNIESGSDGLIFTPYIVGERTPHIDGNIRGSFIGIDTSHTIDHFTKAVLEGITFSLKESQDLMEKIADKSFDRIVSVGGGAKNASWQQIQADIFNTPIVTLKAEEGPGLGAAMIAAVGLGWFDSFEECTEIFVEYSDRVIPNSKNAEKYQKLFGIYKDIYPSTKEISYKLSEISGGN